MNRTRSAVTIRDSRLYRDLYLDHRDTMYRAMTFLAGQGGPILPGDEKEVLIARREPALSWLLAQEDIGELLAAYEDFWRSWDPVFMD